MKLEQQSYELIFSTIWLNKLVCRDNSVSGASKPHSLSLSHAAQNAVAVCANYS